MNGEKHALLKDIAKLKFAQHEAVLFLDTHPKCTEALDYYHYVTGLLNKAVAHYTAEFGPLTKGQVNSEEYFTWAESPWPWEGGCN